MNGSSFGLRTLTALFALTLVAGIAVAQGADNATNATKTVQEQVEGAQGAVDNVTNATTAESPGPGEALAGNIGDALASVGAVIAHATQATARAIGTGIVAIGDGLMATINAVGTAIAWMAEGTWAGITAIAAGTQWLLVQTGQGIAEGALAAADGVAWIAVTVGNGIAAVTTTIGGLVWEGLLGLGRSWSSDPAQHGVVAASASGSAAAAGAAWYTRAWKYLKYAPGLAPLYTRISRDELLDHPKRAEIHAAIQAEPGIHLSQLSRELELSWGTLLHHLRKLEDANLVTSEETQGKRCFFLPGQVSSQERSILPALENEKARKIAEFYAANPGASQSEAADALGYSPALISWHLNNLEDAGVVERERVGRRHQVGITQEAQALVSA